MANLVVAVHLLPGSNVAHAAQQAQRDTIESVHLRAAVDQSMLRLPLLVRRLQCTRAYCGP